MISRYSVWLNDKELAAIDPDIYVADISYMPVTINREATRIAGRHGGYTGAAYVESNSVTISVAVRKYSTAARQQVVQQIARWAASGGWLKTSDRPGQELWVLPGKLAGVESALRWTDTLSIELMAQDFPFWQDEIPSKATVAANGSGTLHNFSVMPVEVEATITATAALTGVTVSCGETSITLQGISVAQGAEIEIRYTEDHHLLEITSGGVSLLDKRTAASADDLIAQPGPNTVSISGTASCEFRCKGAWV